MSGRIACSQCGTSNDSDDRFCCECGTTLKTNATDVSRCGKCSVVITSPIKLKALGKEWHQECFVCAKCGSELKGGFFPHDNVPYCEQDYDELFLKKCTGCNKHIDGTYFDDRRGGIYHPACFKCQICGVLLEQAFFWKDDKACCQSCGQIVTTVFAQSKERCDRCNKPFEHGSKMLTIEKNKYHEHCFSCYVCGTVIGANTYTVAPYDEDKVCCMQCAESGRAEKCSKCGQVMLGYKLSALEKKYHTQCFKCSKCSTNIVENSEFYTGNLGEPICKSCYT